MATYNWFEQSKESERVKMRKAKRERNEANEEKERSMLSFSFEDFSRRFTTALPSRWTQAAQREHRPMRFCRCIFLPLPFVLLVITATQTLLKLSTMMMMR